MLSLPVRRLILAISIIIFLSVGPLVVAYAMGYRYDFQNSHFYQTGLIHLKAHPWVADIFLADQKISWYTPAQINDLKPGTYRVTIKKEGYQDWSKVLAVEAQKATRVEDIVLFLRQPVRTILATGAIKDFVLAPNKDRAAFLEQEDTDIAVKVINLKNDKAETIWPSVEDRNKWSGPDHACQKISWSADGQRLLLTLAPTADPQYVVIDLADPAKPVVLRDLFNLNFDKLAWGANSNELIFRQGENLHILNLTQRDIGAPFTSKVADFQSAANTIYLVRQGIDTASQNKELVRFDPLSNQTTVLNSNIPKSPNYQILVSSHDQVALLTAERNLYLDLAGKMKLLGSNVSGAAWSGNDETDQSKLLWHTPFEIWVFSDDTDGTSDLITSFSQALTAVTWYADNQHLVYNYQNEVYVIELDGQGQRNTALVASNLPPSTTLAVSSKGHNIYLLGITAQNKLSLQRLAVQ